MKHVHAETNGKVIVIDGKEFIMPESFHPKMGDTYWAVNTLSYCVFCEIYDGARFDRDLRISHNMYKTEQEAERALEFWLAVN